MCQHRNSRKFKVFEPSTYKLKKTIKVDGCLDVLLRIINSNTGHITVASCCGHGRYDMTIVCRARNGQHYELIHLIDLPRTRNFYKKDKDGYYYIPEVVR